MPKGRTSNASQSQTDFSRTSRISQGGVKDRGYFDSIYVRTPSGAMFEATVTHADGFTCDEPRDKLGLEVMLAPQLKMSREEMLAQLGYLKD